MKKSKLSYFPSQLVGYTYSGSVLSLQLAMILILASICTGVTGYMYLENFSLIDAFYMTVITISTVGYTEVGPLSQTGKIFSSIFILFNVGIFAYGLAVFTNYVIEGQLFKNMHINLIKNKIDHLNDHVIICGYGKHGKEIAENFWHHNIQFVIIEMNEEEIEKIQKDENKILYIEGDATHDEILQEAGINNAKGLISALGDDADNVFTVLTARQLSPKINIISRARVSKTKKKLELAGADHVIMPEQIGAYYMASLISRPGAIEFFSFLTNQRISTRALNYEDFPESCRGKSIVELNFRKETGATVIGYQNPDGSYIVNPAPNLRVEPNSSFIVLGNYEQMSKVDLFLKK